MTRTAVAPINSLQQFRVITRDAGRADFAVMITGPSGSLATAHVVPVTEGYVVNFTPTDVGEYRLGMTLGGEPVNKPGDGGGPYRVMCTQASDPSKVSACGPGLSGGLVNQPGEFTIDTKKAGQGGLGVTVEGPCEAAINCRDNGDGTCSVAYMPKEVGDYVINITFNDCPIPGSPFNALIGTTADADSYVIHPMLNKVKASGNGLRANGKTAFCRRVCWFLIVFRLLTLYAVVPRPPYYYNRSNRLLSNNNSFLSHHYYNFWSSKNWY